MSAFRCEYIVIKPEWNGSPLNNTVRTDYYSDRVRQPTRGLAISHGFDALGHDDFLIGALRGETLIRLSWMDEDRDDDRELANVAKYLGFAAAEAEAAS